MQARVQEVLETFLVFLKMGSFDGVEFAIRVEALHQFLHVRVFAFAVNTAHLNEVLAFVIKVAHHILQSVFAQSAKQGLVCLCGCEGAPTVHYRGQNVMDLLKSALIRA